MSDTIIDVDGTNKLAAALAKAQADIIPPRKTHTAKLQLKSGSSYEYNYSTLDELIDALRVPLSKNGLSFYQRTTCTERMVGVETVILHESGQQVPTGIVSLPCGDTPQQFGSSHTYARRYSLGAAFGICPVLDDDANEAERGVVQARTKKAEPSSLPPLPPSVQPASLLTLTTAQQVRLKDLLKQHGVKASAVKALVEKAYPIKTAADIRQTDYEDLCAWVIAGGK